METFEWVVDAKPKGAYDFQHVDVGFADGYEVSVGLGINAERQTWSCSFTGDALKPNSTYNQVLNFLRRHGAITPMLWVCPTGETIKVKARELKTDNLGANAWIILWDFRQFY